MAVVNQFSGVYVATITPVDKEFNPDLDSIIKLLEFYAENGCHGALILGTTGEGPSFNPTKRIKIMHAAAMIKQTKPDFRLFAGTGTPSLEETIALNQAAFSSGFDAVVVLPPYYFRSASEDGLFAWFEQVIHESVPEGKMLLGYHIPQVSGIPLKIDLLKRLIAKFPTRFAGVKDSEGRLENTQALAEAFSDRLILVGNDRLLSASLAVGASGCITALANLISPWLRQVYDQFGSDTAAEIQTRIDLARSTLDRFSPFPASVKALMHEIGGWPDWSVLPPLLPLAADVRSELVSQFKPLIING